VAVVATLTKGYDLNYIWRQVDQSATKDGSPFPAWPWPAQAVIG
jgi:hypothetical protein